MSFAMNGPCKGLSLRELIERFGTSLLGKTKGASSFPLLIKILDAREPLSVQVHPNQTTASLLQGESKNEMWYVLEAKPGAAVYAGFTPGMTRDLFLQAIQEGNLSQRLQCLPVSAGDAIYVPGGCVHAIGAGCLMLEVQQNSDTTYRIYDWDRKDALGKSRDLHLDQALVAIDWTCEGRTASALPLDCSSDYALHSVVSAPDFHVQRLDIQTEWSIPSNSETFQVFFCISGKGEISVDEGDEPIEAGMTYFVPATFSKGKITGPCQILRIFI